MLLQLRALAERLRAAGKSVDHVASFTSSDTDTDIEHRLEQCSAKALEEATVDIAFDAGTPKRVGRRRIERYCNTVGPQEPGPADQCPALARINSRLVSSVEPTAALDQNARAVKAVDVALDQCPDPARTSRVERRLEDSRDDGALRDRR